MRLLVSLSDVGTSEGNCKIPRRRFSCVVNFVVSLCLFFNISCVWKVTFGDEDFLANVFAEFFVKLLSVASSGKRTKASFCFLLRELFFVVPLFTLCLRFEPVLPAIEGREVSSLFSEFEYKTILHDDEFPLVDDGEVNEVSVEKEEVFDSTHVGLLNCCKLVIATA